MEDLELRSNQSSAARTANDRERQLILRIGSGDRDAFRELYVHYHRRLARFLTRLTHRQEDAEEIINDTLWIVWQRAAEFRNASQVSTWIMGIAYRRALNMIRRAATHERVMALESAEGEAAVNDPGQSDRESTAPRITRLPNCPWSSASCSSSPITWIILARRSPRSWSAP